MENYNVYGMGNALVDIEFKIPDDRLKTLNITKGIMTLVEQEHLDNLLHALSDIPHQIACGGSAGNTTITAQAFGARTFYSCLVANDKMGDLFYQGLVDMGVDTNLNAHNRATGTTGRCLVKITPDAERTMCTHLGITQTYSIQEIQEEALIHSDYLYIEGYLVASESARAACIAAKHIADSHHTKTAITLSDASMITYFKEGLLNIIGHGVDLLFCNESEAKLFCGTETLEQTTEALKKYAKTFAVTLGSKGALIYDGHTSMIIPSEPVNVINTVGAGDVFAGAFLYALTQGLNYTQAGHLANKAAGKIVTLLGPRLTRAQCLAILASAS